MIEQLYEWIEEVRAEFAPDPRIAVFEVDVAREGAELVLFGAVSVPAAVEALQRRIAAFETERAVRDAVLRIPDPKHADRAHGIITAAVAPMLAGPLISESHLSQVLLGNRVMVLREHGRWLHCRAGDGYLGWIHRGYVHRVGELEARSWEIGAVGPLYFSLGAEVRDGSGRVSARLPWGARFAFQGETVLLPDGREGRLAGNAVALADVAARFPFQGEAVIATARLWTGAPYLWGGTTPWGADCSGFVQAIFRTHGVQLPRDSDHQAAAGDQIDIRELDRLNPGDLLFFAERKDRISHVAISIGGPRIIHSALGNGGVYENDLHGDENYERELRSLLIAGRRIMAPGD